MNRSKIYEYCTNWSTKPPTYLQELDRETNLKTLAPQMLSGPLQGRLLSMISKMLQPSCILEIGTFTGYSALCLAEGLKDDGKLITIEANDELSPIIEKYFQDSDLVEKLTLFIGKAEDIIPELDITPDLVFMDGGKQDYKKHYEICLSKMCRGGFLLADNVLWSAKVVKGAKDQDTSQIHAFNTFVQEDPRVENLILPIRDGIMLVRKR